MLRPRWNCKNPYPMDAEGWFKLLNRCDLVFWLLLAFFPRQSKVTHVVAPVGGVCMLGVAYIICLAQGLKGGSPDFGSLASIRDLFQTDATLLAGWVHYLAFDLFVGCWITRDAVANGVHHAAVLPSLFFTLMFGPVGYLAYLLIRTFVYHKPLFVQWIRPLFGRKSQIAEIKNKNQSIAPPCFTPVVLSPFLRSRRTKKFRSFRFESTHWSRIARRVVKTGKKCCNFKNARPQNAPLSAASEARPITTWTIFQPPCRFHTSSAGATPNRVLHRVTVSFSKWYWNSNSRNFIVGYGLAVKSPHQNRNDYARGTGMASIRCALPVSRG